MTAYFVAVDGEQKGPFTIEQIRTACSKGEIQKQTLMWREGLSEWQHAELVLKDAGIVFAGVAAAFNVPPPLSAPRDVSAPGADWRFEVPAARVAAGRGLSWIAEGWALFKLAPGMWILALLIVFGIQLALSRVRVFGSLASLLLSPLLAVGLLAFAHDIACCGKADIGKLFAGFKDKLGALLILALLYIAMILAVVVVGGILMFVMLGGAELLHATDPGQAFQTILADGDALGFLLVMLVMFVLFTLVATAYWYAPALVFFANQGAAAAMKNSFTASWQNWLPLLFFSLAAIVVVLLGVLPVFLGLLVALPVLSAANYASFRDLFGRQDLSGIQQPYLGKTRDIR